MKKRKRKGKRKGEERKERGGKGTREEKGRGREKGTQHRFQPHAITSIATHSLRK